MTQDNTAQALTARQESKAVAITPMEMLQIAVEQGADLDKLSKLMDLQERWEANEARKAYVHALNEFKKEPPTVKKNKRAGFDSKRTGERTEYEYVTLAQATAVIAPALSEYGLAHRWAVSQSDSGIEVTCFLTHESGHTEQVSMKAPADTSGSKNSIQAIGSTVTYLQRYTLLAITGLAAVDMDDDGRRAVDDEVISEEQKEKLITLQQEVGADTGKFLNYLGVQALDLLPKSKFDDAKAALEKKRK